MEILKKNKREYAHPYIPELESLYRQGRISRREFLRNATLLGMSFGAATLAASCAAPATEEPVAPTAVPTEIPTMAPTDTPEPTDTPAPTDTPVPTGPKRGGVMTEGQVVRGIDHPARYAWIAGDSNITRFVIEYLTLTDSDNVTHPHLLEGWEVSEDLRTWTLNLRQGVTWSTGEPFVADDVIFTMGEWLNEDVGSSMLGLVGAYLSPDGIEKMDDYTVVLHLNSPQIAVPEHFFHYAAPILDHRTFEGDWLENPVGTGPFTVGEWTVGERAVLKARDDYWMMGEDGNPLPYLDELRFIDLGDEQTALVSAIKSGQIDVFFPQVASFQSLKDDPNVVIKSSVTGVCRVLRMRVDIEPYTDNRVRQALKMCQDRQKILDVAYFGEGAIARDFHVAPVHPSYCDSVEPFPYDPERAKALLDEAGYPDGVDLELTVAAEWTDGVSYAETLKQDAEPAGIRIQLRSVPGSTYWDEWTEVPLGITPWNHRSLAVMILPLPYTCDEEGNPVPWNETRWCDEEFSELLQQAQGTLDVEARRSIMCDIERIQRDRGSVGISYWMNQWIIHRPQFKGLKAHPTNFNHGFVHAWYDPDEA
jgi:peptide/nickel transport system substrate-binding protein